MAEDLRALIRRMVEERGLAEYWPQIEQLVQLESGWNTSAHNTEGENSVGLFQNNIAGGLGSGYTVAQLTNPETNATIALDKMASVISGGGSLWDALGDWVNARNIIFSGQGGATMPDGQVGTAPGGLLISDWFRKQAEAAWDRLYGDKYDPETGGSSEITTLFGAPTQGVQSKEEYVTNAYMLALQANPELFPEQAAAYQAGTQVPPTAQEVAISQADLNRLAAQAEIDIQRAGWDVATQNFQNSLTALQEQRYQATAAQEYAQQIAPPGMTTISGTGPMGGRGQIMERAGMQAPPAIPLAPAPAATYQQAMGQAGQMVPQPPTLEYNPPELGGVPNLAALGQGPQAAAMSPMAQMGYPQLESQLGAPMPLPGGGWGWETGQPSGAGVSGMETVGMPGGADLESMQRMGDLLRQVMMKMFGQQYMPPPMLDMQGIS